MSGSKRTRPFAAALVSLTGLGLLAVPSAGVTSGAELPAAEAPPMLPAPAPVPDSPAAAPLSAGVAHSVNWSGYNATGSTYKSASATWTEPSVSCKAALSGAFLWVGLDGGTVGATTVEQTGTEAACIGGKPTYAAFYDMYPAVSVTYSIVVKPGDVMNASVTAKTASTFVLKIRDVTEGWTRSVTKFAAAVRRSAEVILEDACCTGTGGVLPLPDFGTAHFSAAHVNGVNLGSVAPTRVDIATSSILKDTTSALSGGTAFTITWDHS